MFYTEKNFKFKLISVNLFKYIQFSNFLPKKFNIQDIHKIMTRFQKLTRNLFLTLHGHNVHRQQRQLPKLLMR